MLSPDLETFDVSEISRVIRIPPAVTIYGVIPFLVAFLLSLLSSVLFVRYFWKAREYDRPAAILATLGIWIGLLTASLLPVDVFLVSYMKNENGTFKDWAAINTTRQEIVDGVGLAYFTLYGIILLFIFFLLPLVYFAHEEQDEDQPQGAKRFASALKYTIIFVVACILLLLVGAFIPYRKLTPPSKGGPSWDEEIWNLLERMYDDHFVDGLLFVMNILVFIGMITLIVYMGIGMSLFPINSIRGWRSLRDEKTEIAKRKNTIISKISRLQAKENNLSSRERRTLSSLQEEERLVSRMEEEVNRGMSSTMYKLRICGRVLAILSGILAAVVGFLIWLSVLLTNIDRLLDSLGYRNGYIATTLKIPNPLNTMMIYLQQVYPLDYVMFFGVVVLLVTCTIAGVRYIGIWCFCVRLFKIRPHKTQPQAIIILCAILMFTVLAMNILISDAFPQYMAFGHQKYVEHNETTGKDVIKSCTSVVSQDLCVMSRAHVFMLNFTVKHWFFGICYFWMSWGFLAVVIVSFFVALMKGKLSTVSEAVDPDDFDESDSDAQLLVP